MSERALKMLSTALEMEEKGYKFYHKFVAECGIGVAGQIFKLLMEDELVHIQRIKSIYEFLNGGGGWSDEWKLKAEAHENLGQVFRDLAKEYGANISCSTSDLEALNIGLDFEKKAMQFYNEHLRSAQDELEREFLEAMIHEESRHYDLLDDMKFYLTDPDHWFMEKSRSGLDGA